MNDVNDNNVKSPAFFLRKLNIINEQMPYITKSFIEKYVLYKGNPTDDDYKLDFENTQNNMKNIHSNLDNIRFNIKKSTNYINKKLFVLNNHINNIKNENNNYYKYLYGISQENNSSEELNSNYTDMYNNDYLKNWSILLSIIFIFITMKKTFNK